MASGGTEELTERGQSRTKDRGGEEELGVLTGEDLQLDLNSPRMRVAVPSGSRKAGKSCLIVKLQRQDCQCL